MRSLWKGLVPAILTFCLFLSGCGDAYRPVANPIIQPGGDPQNFDSVTVINQNVGSTPGSLSELNVSGDVVTSNRNVGREPVFGTFDFARTAIFIVNRQSETVSATNIGSSVVATVSLIPGSEPVFIGGARNGRLYVANSGPTAAQGATPACPSGSLGIIQTSSAVLSDNICLPVPPKFLVEATGNNRKVFILSSADNKVRIFNIDTNTLSPNEPTAGSNPVWATASSDGSLLYVLNQGSNDITVIDIATEAVIPGAISTGGGSPTYMALDSRLNRLYVANTGSDTVSVFDASKSPLVSLHAPIAVGSAPRAISITPDGSKVFVANTGSNFVSVINSLGFQRQDVTVSTAPGATVTWVGASRLGTKAYASVVEPTDLNNGTAVIRTSDNSLVLTLPAPRRDISTCDPGTPSTTCVSERQRPMMLTLR